MVESTFMYAWTVDAWSRSDGLYVKIGRTDSLHRRKIEAQTYHVTPLQLISAVKYPQDKKHDWDTKLKNHLTEQKVTLGGGTEIFKFATRDDVVKLFETLCLWSSGGTTCIQGDALDDAWKFNETPPPMPLEDDDNESIAETEVPSDDDDECDDLPIVLENVPRLMKMYGINKSWSRNHVREAERACEFGGIRLINDEIVYGGENELLGTRLDPASRASCDLYYRIRRKYYTDRDKVYGRGYLNTILTTLTKIHDARARRIRNKKQKTPTAIEKPISDIGLEDSPLE